MHGARRREGLTRMAIPTRAGPSGLHSAARFRFSSRLAALLCGFAPPLPTWLSVYPSVHAPALPCLPSLVHCSHGSAPCSLFQTLLPDADLNCKHDFARHSACCFRVSAVGASETVPSISALPQKLLRSASLHACLSSTARDVSRLWHPFPAAEIGFQPQSNPYESRGTPSQLSTPTAMRRAAPTGARAHAVPLGRFTHAVLRCACIRPLPGLALLESASPWLLTLLPPPPRGQASQAPSRRALPRGGVSCDSLCRRASCCSSVPPCLGEPGCALPGCTVRPGPQRSRRRRDLGWRQGETQATIRPRCLRALQGREGVDAPGRRAPCWLARCV